MSTRRPAPRFAADSRAVRAAGGNQRSAPSPSGKRRRRIPNAGGSAGRAPSPSRIVRELEAAGRPGRCVSTASTHGMPTGRAPSSPKRCVFVSGPRRICRPSSDAIPRATSACASRAEYCGRRCPRVVEAARRSPAASGHGARPPWWTPPSLSA